MKSLSIVAVLASAVPAAAQSLVPGPNQPGRYEMQPVPGGIARLDTVTGDVSLCRVERGALRCRPSGDDDGASQRRDDERRSDLSDDDRKAGADPVERTERDRTDAEIDRAIGRVKRVFRALGDIAREFDRSDRGEEAGPDRT